ncbi:MAG: signal recognition particle protein, partial [Alphaproteobacteria bacterium]|nr:signal recognition particle protein [Alphaproteobacteria bacterium]
QDTYDTVIYDTAGRLHIADDMMAEVSALKEVIEPDELLLVIDSMMGQDAINTAKAFNDLVQLTGLVLTRVDGDARGGAALSAKYVTNCQIKYMCTGEKVGDIEQFHPDRVASRILDKGDVLGLIEKAIDADIAGSIEDVATGKDFNLNGMAQYLRQLEKLGGFGGFLKFIPGMGRIKEQLNKANITDKTVARQLAIICSMTKTERTDPRILNASRRRRIAAGCAQEVSDVNRLIKQFEQIKAMMSKFKDAGVMRSLAGKFFK